MIKIIWIIAIIMYIIMYIVINNNENIWSSITAISDLEKPSHGYVNTKL